MPDVLQLTPTLCLDVLKSNEVPDMMLTLCLDAPHPNGMPHGMLLTLTLFLGALTLEGSPHVAWSVWTLAFVPLDQKVHLFVNSHCTFALCDLACRPCPEAHRSIREATWAG